MGTEMAVKVKRVFVGAPTLAPDSRGLLACTDPDSMVLDSVFLSRWLLDRPGNGEEWTTTGHLFTKKDGSGPFFVTVVFTNMTTTSFALWDTFEVDFGGPWDVRAHTADLQEALRKPLASSK